MLEIKSLRLREELDALADTGLYPSEESFLIDAVNTLLATRPDVREALACKLYERGIFSLGRAAEWSGLSVETIKSALHRRGIPRTAFETSDELNAMAQKTLRAAGRIS